MNPEKSYFDFVKEYIIEKYGVAITDEDFRNINELINTEASRRSNLFEKVKKVIMKFDLDTKRRVRKQNERRFFLFHLLREENFKLHEIGDAFNRKHDTVIHGLKMHDILTKIKDKSYEKTVEEINMLFFEMEVGIEHKEEIIQ
jgi:uncharacterized protein YpuA (DUF1002 family)